MLSQIDRRTLLGLAVALLLVGASPYVGNAQRKFIIAHSTTSTQNSGLFEHILPEFTKKIGIDVRVVAVGTGQASRMPRTATAMSCSCTQSPTRKNSSPRAGA